MVQKSGKIVVLFSVLAAVLAAPALAGRPLETEDTGIVEPGQFEFELGTTYESGNVVSKSLTAEANVAYGVCENVEVDISVGGVISGDEAGDDITGMGDSSLLLKWRFIGDDESPAAAALCMFTNLPTGDVSKGLGSDEYDVTALLAASFALPDEWVLYLNAGFNFLQTEDNTATVSAAVEKALTDRLALVAEVVLDQSVHGNKEDKSGRGLVGATYSLSDNLVIDFGIGAGFDNRTPDIIGILGATFAF